MKLIFEVIQESGGGYAAACMQERIFAEASSLEELHRNITEAVGARFEIGERPNPADIQLVVYKESAEEEKRENILA